jgi:hypothetical protein
MLIIFDKETKKELQKIFDNDIKEIQGLSDGQQYVSNNSLLGRKILTKHTYDLVFDDKGEIIDITNTKTFEELENNPENKKNKRKQEIQQELETLDKTITRSLEDVIDLLISKSIVTENELPVYLSTKKQKKKELRQQLKDL